jgi:hypothetical protein
MEISTRGWLNLDWFVNIVDGAGVDDDQDNCEVESIDSFDSSEVSSIVPCTFPTNSNSIRIQILPKWMM